MMIDSKKKHLIQYTGEEKKYWTVQIGIFSNNDETIRANYSSLFFFRVMLASSILTDW